MRREPMRSGELEGADAKTADAERTDARERADARELLMRERAADA